MNNFDDRKLLKALMLLKQNQQIDNGSFDDLPQSIREVALKGVEQGLLESEVGAQESTTSDEYLLMFKAAASSGADQTKPWFSEVQPTFNDDQLVVEFKEQLNGKHVTVDILSKDGSTPLLPDLASGEIEFTISDGLTVLLFGKGALLLDNTLIEGEAVLNPDIEHKGYRPQFGLKLELMHQSLNMSL